MMMHLLRVPSRSLLLAIAAMVALSSCASAKKDHPLGYIKKANNYHLEPSMRIETDDPMIAFEYRHLTYGAIETADYEERYGHYISAVWAGVPKSSQVVVRFEYRQSKTGAAVLSTEAVPDRIRRSNTTNFQVTGADYAQGGPITAWRIVLLVDGEVADEYRSFLWK